MRRVLALTLTGAALLLAGCSGGDDKGDLDSASSKPSAEEGEKFTAKDGDDYDACRDGGCEVEVDGSATIPLDDEFGVTRFGIEVEGDTMTVNVEVSGGYSSVSITGDGTANVQGFLVSTPLVNDDVAVVNIDHQG